MDIWQLEKSFAGQKQGGNADMESGNGHKVHHKTTSQALLAVAVRVNADQKKHRIMELRRSKSDNPSPAAEL